MRWKYAEGSNVRFTVLNPTGKRRSFRIERRTYDLATWKRIGQTAVKHPTFDTINAAYKSGKLDFETARKNVDDIAFALSQQERVIQAVVHTSDNLRHLEAYLAVRYPPARQKKLSDYSSALAECKRAIEALGTVSILSGTRDEIQNAIDAHCGQDSTKQRRIVGKVSAILPVLRPNGFDPISWTTRECAIWRPQCRAAVPRRRESYVLVGVTQTSLRPARGERRRL